MTTRKTITMQVAQVQQNDLLAILRARRKVWITEEVARPPRFSAATCD